MKLMTNETPISIRIPAALLRRLDEEAAKQSRSRSNLIVLLIEQATCQKALAALKPTKKKSKTKDVRETAHYRLDNDGRKGRARQFRVVPKEDYTRDFVYEIGWTNLTEARRRLEATEQRHGESDINIREGIACDHDVLYDPIYDKDGKEIECQPHSVNPECEDCTQVKAAVTSKGQA